MNTCALCYKSMENMKVNKFYPFCSSRCRMADLDRWVKGDYQISGNEDNKISQEENINESSLACRIKE